MRIILVLSALLILQNVQNIAAQPKLSVQHYGIEDGLPQKTVMDILQDQKGFMWFSTWDGISKFDGATFRSYILNKEDTRLMRGNRFDKLYLDKHGYIWTQTHDNDIYRFDPRLETFSNIRWFPQFKNNPFHVSKVIPTASGKVWLVSNNEGCICFKDTVFKPMLFNIGNDKHIDDQVREVFEDKEKRSWILTDNGLFQFSPDLKSQRSYFTNGVNFFSAVELGNEIWFGSRDGNIYIFNKGNNEFRLLTTGSHSIIGSLKKIDEQHLLICSAKSDFFSYDATTGNLKRYAISPSADNVNTVIKSCYIDTRKNAWIETGTGGVTCFNTKTGTVKYYPIKTAARNDNLVTLKFLIWEDINHHLWIHSSGGGFVLYDPLTDKLIPVADMRPADANLFSSMLYAGFSDKQGNLWLSTRSQGIEKLILNDPAFTLSVVNPKGNNNVRSMLEDSHHRVWIATKDGTITIYNSGWQKLGIITGDGVIGTGKPLGGMAYSMIEDAESNIWIGTKGEGVYKLVPDGWGKKFKVLHYVTNKADPYSLTDNRVYRVFVDSRNRVWIGTYAGGLNLADNHVDGRFYNFKNQFKNYPINAAYHIRSIAEDRAGKLYVGATLGLFVITPNTALNKLDEIRHYKRSPTNAGLGANDIYDICTTSNGDIYIATFGGGFDKVVNKDKKGFPTRFFNYSTKNGVVSDLIQQIKEDEQHRLWIVCEANLMRFDPVRNTFENHYDIARLIKGDNFSEGGNINTSTGNLILGTTGGFISINTAKLKADAFNPYMAITGFRIANHDVPIGNASPLASHIDDMRALILNSKQNFITLSFAALDMSYTRQMRYQYKLDGVDNDWIDTRERSVNYINLSPGNYVFHVRSTNSKGLWINNEHQLPITIVPAIWQTWWAIILYLLAGLSLVFFVSRWIITFYRLKDRLLLEKEQTEMKTNFFTDISHELRTPLTMIVSPVEQLLEEEGVNRSVKDRLQLVLKNSQRMLRLVNQILDFRKIQNQLLLVREIAIGEQIAAIAGDFTNTAGLHGITLKVNDESRGKSVWLDPDSLEKMMFNLLSNAVKYTPKGGVIEINIFQANDKVAVQVKDYGTGMNNEIIRELFSRFVSHNPDKTKPSTGIGLSIVKEIVDRHGAEIKVESQQNIGSTFTILFLTGAAHFARLENIVITDAVIKPDIIVKADKSPDQKTNPQIDTLLLIEDDDDLRQYLSGLLSADYKVLQANNGEAALAIVLKEVPDFIVSDIMMPKMDGFAFLKALRDHPLTSHIPLIFLTAKTDPDTEIAAYERGADAFMTKPFTAKLLRSRIKTMMEQRKRLYSTPDEKNTATVQAKVAGKSQLRIVDLNESFLIKIKQEIEKNISNPTFSVDDLISIMPMSRTVFVKKLKSLTGQSPVEYIRTVKINHAARLIETRQYSIKEISHMVGISDTKYFAHRFKEVMGMLPKEYKKQSE
ncbi:two-component regulator propeller domain-containing protein [Mucilaginibacter boryungensis]|uniref:histidine kinase n=1 Tax=Mucilaginibacter boryungensis TaxID=768480 RepID=A0ABR9XJE3_9SPHI|nr:two-component regulator propeller domain-containing protein [Mucilaginibacter boryungensis]MBE9667165.1 response regulator [Mucilaginibacter boryungensis]